MENVPRKTPQYKKVEYHNKENKDIDKRQAEVNQNNLWFAEKSQNGDISEERVWEGGILR